MTVRFKNHGDTEDTEILGDHIIILRESPCPPCLRGLSGRTYSFLFAIFYAFALVSCGFSRTPVEKGSRFAEGFVKAGEGGELHHKMRVNRRGRLESSLVLVAPIVAGAEIRDASGPVKLQFL